MMRGWWAAHVVLAAAALAGPGGLVATAFPRPPALQIFRASGDEVAWPVVEGLPGWPVGEGVSVLLPFALRRADGDTLEVTSKDGARVALPWPGGGGDQVGFSVHRRDDRYAIVSWTSSPGRVMPAERAAGAVHVIGPVATAWRLPLPRERPAFYLVLLVGALALAVSLHSRSRARPWYRRGGLATWREGTAKDGHIAPLDGGSPVAAPDVQNGPVLFQSVAPPPDGATRASEEVEAISGSRAAVHALFARDLRIAALAALAASGAFLSAPFLARPAEAPAPAPSAHSVPDSVLGAWSRETVPGARRDLAIRAPLPECPGRDSARFHEALSIGRASSGLVELRFRETFVNGGDGPCEVAATSRWTDGYPDGIGEGLRLGPYETKTTFISLYPRTSTRWVELRGKSGPSLKINLFTRQVEPDPQHRTAAPAPPVVPGVVSPSGRLTWRPIEIDARFRDVRSFSLVDGECHEVADLTVDDAHVAREEGMQPATWLVLELSFLRGRRVDTRTACESRRPFAFVHGEDERRIAEPMGTSAPPAGARVVLAWPISADARAVSVDFGTPPRTTNTVNFDLDRAEGIVVRAGPEVDDSSGGVDLRAEWAAEDHRAPRYRARRYVRSMPWDRQSRPAVERMDPLRVFCDARTGWGGRSELWEHAPRELVERACPSK